ncbi:MAG: hypothetical protein K2X90_02395 [Candidatus Babeliaceae bacterium]|nr:hypothetical protein [Candidatus Babeliaceae bacterium]
MIRMLLQLSVFGILVASSGLLQAKTCTDFDRNNNIIGSHTAWVHCQASDGKQGTVNSCNCDAPQSIECRTACKKLF